MGVPDRSVMRLLTWLYFASLGTIQILCRKAVALVTCSMKLLLALVSTSTELHDKPRVPGLLRIPQGPSSSEQSLRQVQIKRRSSCHCPCAQSAVARQDTLLQLRTAHLTPPMALRSGHLRLVRLHILFGVVAHVRGPP